MNEQDMYDPTARFQLQATAAADSLGALETLTGGAIAAIADAGTTIWNSVTPEKMEVSTADLLSRVSNNALQLYNEHPDAVHTASFIVGAVAPIGIAMKGMSMLRNGAKGFSWFASDAAMGSKLAEVEAAYANGIGNTVKVKEMQNAFYRAKAYNVIADNVAAEVLINLTMSAHPWMEDYQKNLGYNFLFGVALGSGIGGTLSHIAARHEVAKVKMGVEKPFYEALRDSAVPIDAAAMAGDNFMRRAQRVDNLEAHLAAADNPLEALTLTPLVKDNLRLAIQEEKGRLKDDFLRISSQELKDSPIELQESIQKLVTSPEFAQLDSISFLHLTETARRAEGDKAGMLKSSFDWIVNKVTPAKDNIPASTTLTAPEGIWSSVHKAFLGKSEVVNYATIADLNTSMGSIVKSIVPKDYQAVNRGDALINSQTLPTHLVQEDQAKALLYLDSLTAKQLEATPFLIAHGDLAMMNAFQAKLYQLEIAGESTSLIRYTTEKIAATPKLQELRAIHKLGFSPSYLADLAKIDANREAFHLYNDHNKIAAAGLSDETIELLRRWVGGNTETLRKAALREIHPDLHSITSVTSKADDEALAAIRESIYHPNTIALRESLHALSPDGYALLYRGLRTTPKGHNPVESYSLNPDKAGAFAGGPINNRLYKVKIDDIIASIEDFGPTTYGGLALSNSEVLVLNRATRENIPVNTATKIVNPVGSSARMTKGADELLKDRELTLMTQIEQLKSLGFGSETIALRTGATKASIDKLLLGGHLEGAEFARFKYADDIEKALAPENRALVISSNINKHNAALSYANLNAQNLDTMTQGLLEAFTKSSPNPLVRSIGETLNSAESKMQIKFLGEGLADLLPSGTRSTLLTSANFTLDRMGAFGMLATGYGKKVIHMKTEAQKNFTAPLSATLNKIVGDEAGMVEFFTALNVGASISGKKIFQDGQWWQFTAPTKAKFEEVMNLPIDQFRIYASSIDEVTGKPMLTAKTFKEAPYSVVTPSVNAALKEMQLAGRELYHLKNTKNKVEGKTDLSDLGFWSPANNPRDKQIAYSFNRDTREVTMLMAKSPAELLSHVEVYKKELGEGIKKIDIVLKGDDQLRYNQLAGRHDPLYMAVSDASKQHGGSSSSSIVQANPAMMSDLIQGYDHSISKGIDDLVKHQLGPISEHLNTMSIINNYGFSDKSLGVIAKATHKPQDTGQIVGNILLGRSNLEQHEGWATLQTGFQVMADSAIRAISELSAPIIGKAAATPADWIKFSKDMKDRGIVNPFQSFEAYLTSKGKGMVDSPRLIALSNGMAATVILRAGDMAHALVNLVGMPILTSAAINRKMQDAFAGATLDPTAKFSLYSAATDGLRLMNHPVEGPKWSKLAEAEKMLKPNWREMQGLMAQVHSLDRGIVAKLEAGLESKWVKWVSTASDKSEELGRNAAFFVGVGMAKKAYPGLSDTGVMTFARNFMDESIGNYTSAQRPAAFQGSLGVAMGLFQTYMVTYAQSMYRQIETRDFKALAQMMLTQATIFGTGSLPGFTPISEAIGEHFSDNHVDLRTGTFRAIGDPAASMLLYGLPSQIVGLATRGDVSPRVPNIASGLDTLVAVNVATQAYDAMERVAKAAFTADGNTGKAILEAISLQSISRPLARMSELASGHSITARGEVINEDTLTWQSVAARVMATRPIEEIKLREAKHLNSLYGAIDRDNKKAVTLKLRSYMTNGNLDEEKKGELANQYMRSSGSATGWRSAVNEALIQTKQPGSSTVRDSLRPNSPSNYMMNDLD